MGVVVAVVGMRGVGSMCAVSCRVDVLSSQQYFLRSVGVLCVVVLVAAGSVELRGREGAAVIGSRWS